MGCSRAGSESPPTVSLQSLFREARFANQPGRPIWQNHIIPHILEYRLFFGLFDQTIHSRETSDTAAILASLHDSVMRVPMSPGTNFSASFGHMCGYDAQYYGYMWSEVFSDDMFQSVFKRAPLDRAAGRKYCDTVLARGGSMDAKDMLREFLGREPNQNAFLAAKGLAP